MRRATPAILAFLLAACGAEAIPADDVSVRVTADAAEVDLGVGFPLTVVRIWRRDHIPMEWDDAALAPLVLALLATDRVEDGERVMETRRFRAHAFFAGEVAVPPIAFRARPSGGGAEVAASAPGFSISVRPALDPAAPGEPELPVGLLGGGSAWPAIAGALAALAGLGLFLLRRSRSPPAPVAAAPAPAPGPARDLPSERAIRRLGALRARAPNGPEEIAAFYLEASGLVRDYLTDRFHVPAARRTTEELTAGLRAPEPAPGHLSRALAAADLVKFAGARPGAEEHARTLDAAEAFVRETSPAGENGGTA